METRYKYVKKEDVAAYSDFCRHHFLQIASRSSFPELYHYTTGNGLISILESGSLWATQIACLNDSKELLYSVDLLLSSVIKRKKEAHSAEVDLLLDAMERELRDSGTETVGAFVICFSQRRDDLSQWRAYSGGEGGYCLQFDFAKLHQGAHDVGGFIVPVEYDLVKQEIFAADVVKWTETFFIQGLDNKRAPSREKWLEEFLRCWFQHISYFAPLFKHPSFRDEQEWRILYYLKDSDVPNMRFHPRPTMISRHIPMKFAPPNDSGYRALPVVGVIVGPSRHKEISRISVGDILKSRGYPGSVPVILSDIPFRTT